MIPRETIDRIFETADILEVVGEFVTLRKNGSGFRGRSPWTDEKTPSFYVVPAKGIFKDFSSGKGGSVVTFLMEHEGHTYPEALRWLANRYGIEIEEKELTPEQKEAVSERESLYIVNNWAQGHFEELLWNNDQGKAIGLSYLKERGFSDETIKDFHLGYSLDSYDTFHKAANEAGYKDEYLLQTGLIKEKEARKYDAYRGRVIFPIHNLSGRVVGFGARTLKTDKKVPKYINSPESDIYFKSKILYGLHQSKASIISNDMCYLVEGYTDVISFHQAGIKNVVASSGTSLTVDQIKLISRYTKNITVLFDGDAAGLKAAFRGIDMILEQGLNVRCVTFPDGEDPDSFARSHDQDELKEFLTEASKDFIVFKADVLTAETKDDPIKRAETIRSIVQSIAKIPDAIARSVYVQQCSRSMGISEEALLSELNKSRRQELKSKHGIDTRDQAPPQLPPDFEEVQERPNPAYDQELDLIRILLTYGAEEVTVSPPAIDENDKPEDITGRVDEFIISEIEEEQLEFTDDILKQIYQEYLKAHDDHRELEVSHFVRHENPEIGKLVAGLSMSKYELHNWEEKEIIVRDEKFKLVRAMMESILSFKSKKLDGLIGQIQLDLKQEGLSDDDALILMKKQKDYVDINKELASRLGRVVLK